MTMRPLAGFYGKLPARGDFVGAGLPADTVSGLDEWIAGALRGARDALGDAFNATWERAPHWRFVLGPGQLHRSCAASGVWVPSVDRADRAFPLIALVLHDAVSDAREAVASLETLLLDAVEAGLPPEWLSEQIAAAAAARAPRRTMADPALRGWWWRYARHDGHPVTLSAASLPQGDTFLALLRRVPGEEAQAAITNPA